MSGRLPEAQGTEREKTDKHPHEVIPIYIYSLLMKTTPEIEELKKLTEKKYRKSLSTTTDFEEFSITLKRERGEELSAATMKRLWGYVKDEHKPRVRTIDILARYIGHEDYKDFCNWLKKSPNFPSSFFQAEQVMSANLTPGQKVTIGWSPNRTVRLGYQGNSTYEVLSSENSKLKVGDRFMCGNFIKGYPLYLSGLERDGEKTPPYVAGRNGGLTVIQTES